MFSSFLKRLVTYIPLIWIFFGSFAVCSLMEIGGQGNIEMIGGSPQNYRQTTEAEDREKWSVRIDRQLREHHTLPRGSAGDSRCCIFRAPSKANENIKQAYEPRTVSIGPYHHGRNFVHKIERCKPWYFSKLLDRVKAHGVGRDAYFNAIYPMMNEIRECYSEPPRCSNVELIEMMVLDGCFIIHAFHNLDSPKIRDENDPILKESWILTQLFWDFCALENQIPFFVLEKLYELSTVGESESSLIGLALRCFNRGLQMHPSVIEKSCQLKDVKHLLHLVQLVWTNIPPRNSPAAESAKYLQFVPVVKQLSLAGVKFEHGSSDRLSHDLLDVRFHNGVLYIPQLKLDDFTAFLFLNCVAFERCYKHASKHVTTYMIFLRCLLRNADDVDYLCDCRLLKNLYGSNKQIVTYFDDVTRDVVFNIRNCYLAKLFVDISEYTENPLCKMSLKGKYIIITFASAVILLVLTAVQTTFGTLAYFLPPK